MSREDFVTAWNTTSGLEQVPALAGETAVNFLIPRRRSQVRVTATEGVRRRTPSTFRTQGSGKRNSTFFPVFLSDGARESPRRLSCVG